LGKRKKEIITQKKKKEEEEKRQTKETNNLLTNETNAELPRFELILPSCGVIRDMWYSARVVMVVVVVW